MIIKRYLGHHVSEVRGDVRKSFTGLTIVEVVKEETGEITEVRTRRYEKEEAGTEFIDEEIIIYENSNGTYNMKFSDDQQS